MNTKINSPSMMMLLRNKLEIAFREEWHEERPTRFEIIENANGAILKFFLRARSDEWLSVHESEITGLKSESDVDRALAETLSVFLMGHYRWPR